MTRALGSFLLTICCVLGPLNSRAGEIVVFAAASLTDVLQEGAREFQRTAGHEVIFNFASSALLARQIEQGARADVFCSADEEKIARLEKQGLIMSDSIRVIASNTLVVVVPSDSSAEIHSLRDLLKLKRLALAEPASVPAGIYARKELEAAGVWDQIEERVVPVENVRAALAAVGGGNVDAGIVYQSDALISDKIRTALLIPPSAANPITYPAAVLAESRNPGAATHFTSWLREHPDMFRRHGFIPVR